MGRFWKKGELTFEVLIPWLIGIGVLILMIALYFILNGKGVSAADYFKNLWRFGK
ncbi:MAG: hypothetical protein Q8P57_02280 [Candidatus Pacearchaeota archaeon]|nr:hypothetical protein [Candidatus Pacearchaeota archaeon]